MRFPAQGLLGLLGLDRLFELLLSRLMLAKFLECRNLSRFLFNFLCLVINLGLVFVLRLGGCLSCFSGGLGHAGLGILCRFAIFGCILLCRFFSLCSSWCKLFLQATQLRLLLVDDFLDFVLSDCGLILVLLGLQAIDFLLLAVDFLLHSLELLTLCNRWWLRRWTLGVSLSKIFPVQGHSCCLTGTTRQKTARIICLQLSLSEVQSMLILVGTLGRCLRQCKIAFDEGLTPVVGSSDHSEHRARRRIKVGFHHLIQINYKLTP